MADTPSSNAPPRLAIFTSVLTGGGIQRSMRDLAVALVNQGYRVDLIVCHGDPNTENELHEAGVCCRVLKPSLPIVGRLLALQADPCAWRQLLRPVLLPFKSSTKLRYLAALRDYLRVDPPEALASAGTNCNLVAIWARRMTKTATRITVTERNMLSKRIGNHGHKWRSLYTGPLVAHAYRHADAVCGVSRAVADDLEQSFGLAKNSVGTVFNPTVNDSLRSGRKQTVDHPWFHNKDRPIVLSVGRLVKQKDHETLLRAFARVLETKAARLVIVGDGPLREPLEKRCAVLGIDNDVAWIGWDDNPFAYMAAADALVLSSWWEGLPGVLIQALACGCPVVATDCPGGSAEILDDGKYGNLVPVGDSQMMANAIDAMIAHPPDRERLIARGEVFSAESAARRYAEVMLGHNCRERNN